MRYTLISCVLKKSIPLTVLLLFVFGGTGSALEPISIDESLQIINIGPDTEYLLDEGRALTIEDLTRPGADRSYNWQASHPDDLRLGYVRAAVWVRFSARNTSGKEIEWLLQQNHFSMTHLVLYVLSGRTQVKTVETGVMFRYDSRPFDDPTFVFPLKLKPGEVNDYYLRFTNKYPMSINLRAASLPAFYKERDSMLPFLWIMYGFFIVMIGYNIILFLSMWEKSYFYYTLFIASFLAYMMHYNGHAGQYLWGNCTPWANNMGLIFLSMMVATVVQFVRHFISLWEYSAKLDITARVLIIANIIIGILSLFLNKYIWYGIFLIATVIFSLSLGYLALTYIAIAKKSRQAKIYLFSSALLFVAAMVFSLRALDIIPDTFLSSYGVLIGGAFQVVVLSIGIADKINLMRRDIHKAERRYRHIIESSTEIIFLLDGDLNIVSINNAVEKHLGRPVEEFVGKNFPGLIRDTWSERTQITRQLVEEQIAELFENKSSVQFRTSLQSHEKSEPEDFVVKLEYIDADDLGYKILGKVSPVTDDILLKYLNVEHFIYTMDNYLNNADLMSLRLTRNLVRYLPAHDIPLVRVAIREVLVNAIEHGNLGISFDEKTRALEKGNYFDIIHQRQRDPGLGGKKLLINYTLEEKQVVYAITDEGEGFDYKKIMGLDPMQENQKLLTHGRGLIMARATFDSIEFNERGNTIILKKKF
ncbi:MAG: ATP-binding protein [Spirochaetes bacterium]|nr:ATP-binding protein [Spirochaetota bacterium]